MCHWVTRVNKLHAALLMPNPFIKIYRKIRILTIISNLSRFKMYSLLCWFARAQRRTRRLWSCCSRFRLAIFSNILNYSVTCIVTDVFTEAAENTSTKLTWRNPCFKVPFHFISTSSPYLIVIHSWSFCGHTWFICDCVVVLHMCHIYTVHCTI